MRTIRWADAKSLQQSRCLKDTQGGHGLAAVSGDVKRNLTKITYRIHTDAIKANLIPPELTKTQASFVYANEADVLNMALFGKTAKQWRDENPDAKGNIRDEANAAQLICSACRICKTSTRCSSTRVCRKRRG